MVSVSPHGEGLRHNSKIIVTVINIKITSDVILITSLFVAKASALKLKKPQ